MAQNKAKACVKCGRVLPLDAFYKNNSWKEQLFHDAWCKECYAGWCKDLDTLKVYMEENNRIWDDGIW